MNPMPPHQPPDRIAIRRHRAPHQSFLAVLGARLAAGVPLLAALAAGGLVADRTPDADQRVRPFVVSGAIDTAVPARTFDATVLAMRGAGTITAGRNARDTGGVWVLVQVRLVARDEPITLGYAALLDERGREYLATERFSQALIGGRTLQPGLPVTGEIAFEVPRAAAVRLSLRLAAQSLEHRMDAMIEVALPPADPAAVERWATDAKPAVLASPSAVR
jgi:hypothetical protein